MVPWRRALLSRGLSIFCVAFAVLTFALAAIEIAGGGSDENLPVWMLVSLALTAACFTLACVTGALARRTRR